MAEELEVSSRESGSELEFRIRGINPTIDTKYIYKSWFGQVQDNDIHYRNVPVPVLSHHMSKIIQHHIDHSQWLMLTLSPKHQGPEYDLRNAWMSACICATLTEAAPIVHFLYVRRTYRGNRMGNMLLKEMLSLHPVDTDIAYYSMMTPHVRDWARKHKGKRNAREVKYLDKSWLFNPYALTYTMKEDWYL